MMYLFILTFFIKATTLEDSILVDGHKRTYIIDLPAKANGKRPLLLVLHGGFGSAAQAKSSYKLSAIGAKKGYAVVYADGIVPEGRLKIRTWNAGGCCGYAAREDIDDVKFLSMLIDKLVKEQNVDPDQVFVTGMSNGAMMAYRLACEIPEKIRAIAPVAGYVLPQGTCGSSVPILHFHSLHDEHVPFRGGKGKGPSNFSFPSLEEVMGTWENINGCAKRDTTHYENYNVIHWKKCGADTKYYITKDGGHSWPGADNKPRPRADPPSTAVDANTLMFDFFETVKSRKKK